MKTNTVDLVAITPLQLKEMETEAYNKGRRSVAIDRNKAHKERLESIKYMLGLTSVLVLPPFLMVCHWLTMGY